jgi:hypothetical protein
LKPVAAWARPFDDPVLLPGGRELVTLRDAADYIMKLPKAEQNLEAWQTAVEALIMAAEDRGPLNACAHRRAEGVESRPRPQTCERLRATLNPESADTFAGVAQHAISRRHLESSELVRPSLPSPSQHAQAWYGKFRVLLLPPADTQFPKE